MHILEALENTSADSAAVIDFTRPLPSDAMKTHVDGSRVTFLGKTLPEQFASGNAIGMYRFSARTSKTRRCASLVQKAGLSLKRNYPKSPQGYDAAASGIPVGVPDR